MPAINWTLALGERTATGTGVCGRGGSRSRAPHCPGPVRKPGRQRAGESMRRTFLWPAECFRLAPATLQALGWGALRGVLRSRGIPMDCWTQHTIQERGRDKGNARRNRRGGGGVDKRKVGRGR